MNSTAAPILESLLGSRLRAALLGWLFCHPDERFFVRQLAGLLGEDSTNVSRELARLGDLGLLTVSQKNAGTAASWILAAVPGDSPPPIPLGSHLNFIVKAASLAW